MLPPMSDIMPNSVCFIAVCSAIVSRCIASFLRYIASHFVMTYQYTLVQPCDYLRILYQVWLYAQTSLVVQSHFCRKTLA